MYTYVRRHASPSIYPSIQPSFRESSKLCFMKVNIYMTTYMHICLDIYFHICTYASSTNRTQTKTLLVYVGICILIYACIYAYMTTYMHIGLDMYLYTCMYAPIYACIYAYITTNMDICLRRSYIYAYMHPSMPRRTRRSPIPRKNSYVGNDRNVSTISRAPLCSGSEATK